NIPTENYIKQIRHAFLIGDAASAFATSLDGKVPVKMSGDLATAVRDAARCAATADDNDGGDAPVVILSPACASFDQYPNFTLRGDHFRDLVAGLRAEGAA
ncbi:MAG: UDP-N-acetylmuramoyl-L-alanine--D-glutamate ligase, partial [Alphaproteobacteria bacterium]